MPEVLTRKELDDDLEKFAQERAATDGLARLERAVIEAAKAEHEAHKAYLRKLNGITADAYHEAKARRERSVDALIDFESKQVKK